MDRGVSALLGADRPRAADVAALRGHARCCGPCGSSVRSDGSAAGRRRRSRARRAAAALSRRPRSRPTSAGRARTTRRSARARRSTSTPSFTSSSTSPCRSSLSTASASSSDTSAPRSARPSESSPARSVCPPSSLRVTSRCQDAIRSVHAMTLNSQRPGASTVNEPRQRSFPSGSSGASRQRRAPGGSVADRRAEHVVAVAKDRRGDDDVLADDALDGVAPAVDLRLHVADQDRGRRLFARRCHWA